MAACVWALIRPGMMMPPPASMRRTTDQSVKSAAGPTARMRSPATATAPSSIRVSAASMVSTMPFEIKRSADWGIIVDVLHHVV